MYADASPWGEVLRPGIRARTRQLTRAACGGCRAHPVSCPCGVAFGGGRYWGRCGADCPVAARGGEPGRGAPDIFDRGCNRFDREDDRVSSQAASRSRSLLFMAQQVRLLEAQARQREAHDRAVAAQARERAHLLAVQAQDAAHAAAVAAHNRAAAQQQAARAAQVARTQQAAAQQASSQQAAAQQAAAQQAAAQQAASQQAAAAQPVKPSAQPAPAPAPASSDSYSSSSAWAGSAHATRVRNCESGDNYQTNTGNGYYGAYQFSEGTWQSVGGHGYPQQNSVQEQDYRAYLLWQRSGWSSWGCA